MTTGQEYLQEHTINEASIKKFNLEVFEDKVVIPITDSTGKLLYKKERLLTGNKKFHIPAGVSTALFNSQAVKDRPGYVIIAGGEIDCVRLDQEGLHAISSTGGEASFKDEWVAQVKDIPNIFLCLDNDKAGEKATAKIAKLLPQAKVVRFPEGVKDVCEYFKFHTKNNYVKLMEQAQIMNDVPEIDETENYTIHTLKQLLEREYPLENWIIEKFLPQEGIVMFSGDAGVGKSFMLLEIVKCITNKTLFLDHFEIKTPDVPILVIDKENGSRRLQKRIKGMNILPTDDVYFLDYPENFTLEDEGFILAVQEFVKSKEIKIVLLDSFIDILLGDENSPTDTGKIFNALRQIAPNICWVILHHEVKPVAKQPRLAIDRARGSSNIKGQVDYLFSLQKTKTLKIINIEQAKARDYELLNTFAVEFISENEEMAGFRYMGEVKQELKLVEEVTQLVYEHLKTNTMISTEELTTLAEQNGYTARTTRDAIKILTQKGFIDAIKKPGYGNKKFYFVIEEGGEEDDSSQIF